MALTDAQRATLKTHIQSTQDLNALYVDGNLSGLADLLNTTAAPDYWIWRNAVTQDEIMQNGFDWVRVDNLSVGKARIWEWMFDNLNRAIDPSKPNVQLGIIETWKGTQADLDVRLAVFQHCQAKASRFEKVYATGSGTPVNVNGAGPATTVVYGPLAWQELIGL